MIEQISIRNFRSLVDVKFKTSDLCVVVGDNDTGKSNILRSLDLFFNGEWRHGYELDWTRDFSRSPISKSKRADEIRISLRVKPPSSFKDSSSVLWTKFWRQDGFHRESITNHNGKKLPSRTKIPAYLHSLRFDYVPALKGSEYFRDLLGSVYEIMSETVEQDLRYAADGFTAGIESRVKPLIDELHTLLRMKSSVALPTNLRDLFQQLEFSSETSGCELTLSQRGDGVRVQHIPVILRWIATQANHLSKPGKPKVDTIWGFEEPENGLEMSRAFEAAADFLDGSEKIQTFITTHSPVFYSIAKRDKIGISSVISVDRPLDSLSSKIEVLQGTSTRMLDQRLGLVTLLEPHVEEARLQLEDLTKRLSKGYLPSKPVIFLEGPVDKCVCRLAIESHAPGMLDQVEFRISEDDGGGHSWVGNQLRAWHYSHHAVRALGLFDLDADAATTMSSVRKLIHNGNYCTATRIQLSDELKDLNKKKLGFGFSIDELVGESAWLRAEKDGLLVGRENLIQLTKYNKTDKTFEDFILEAKLTPHQQRIITRKIPFEQKKAWSKIIASEFEKDPVVLDGLERTIQKLKTTLKL